MNYLLPSIAALLLCQCARSPSPDSGPAPASAGAATLARVEPARARPEAGATATPPQASSALTPRVNKEESGSKLEQVFADPQYQLTGVAITSTGRLFTNYPVLSPVHKYCLVEIVDGQAKPYPNEEMNSWKEGDDGLTKWVSVQAVYADDQDKLWVVDPAAPFFGDVYKESDKLVRIDLATNAVERTYRLQGITDKGSYINDVRVDTGRQFAYMTNSSQGALVVVDLKSGKTRMVLKGTRVVLSDPSYRFTVGGRELAAEGKPLKANSDGIALSPDREWLYFKPITDDKLYRVRTAYLRDGSLKDSQLLKRVEDLGHFTTTDGMEFDKQGNLYFGDLENDSIVKITPDFKKTTLLKDDRLLWPDSYAMSADGYLYVSTSQVQTAPTFNGGVDKRSLPYGIFRLKVAP